MNKFYSRLLILMALVGITPPLLQMRQLPL